MQISCCSRWLLVLLLLISTCLLVTYAKGGRGGGGRSSSSSRSYSRPSPSYSRPSPSYSRPAPAPSYSRPAPAPSYSRPAPAPSYSRPAPAPSYSRPAPAPAPSYSRPAPAPAPSYSRPSYRPAYKPSAAPAYKPKPAPKPSPRPEPPVAPKVSEPVLVKQPAYNPNFKESDNKQGAVDRQPAYNPNYKPGIGGPPPPYSPAGQPVPNAPVGPAPPYQPGASAGKPPPGVQPPPYPGPPNVRPPAYPGQSAPYPVQPSYPGGFHSQPGVNRPYPVQPGYPGSYPRQPASYPVQPSYPGGFHSQPGVNRPYPVQPGYPGSYPHSPGVNRPYPVQPGHPGSYNSYPGVNGPHSAYNPRPLGGNVWQPNYGVPAPAYMNYGGIPTGANMYTKPHKKKGFIGSLMSMGKSKPEKQHKYYGSYPSPYGVRGGGIGHMGGGFLGKHGSSASMYTIFPYMAAKKIPKISKPKFGFGYMPIYMPRHHYHYYHHHGHHYGGEIDPKYADYYDMYDDDYIGKCQQPIKRNHSEIKCKSTYEGIQCDARCEDDYEFPHDIKFVSNKCWHVTGVWKPKKNFPDCKPVCKAECLNGGQCIRPRVCKCPADYRGDRCQFHFLKCDIRTLIKGQKIGWVCRHFKNETLCKITCKEPGQFESPPAAEYRCTPDGVWKPDTIPQCVVKKEQDIEVIFLGD